MVNGHWQLNIYLVISLSARILSGFFCPRNQSRIIQPASMAERKPRAQPVPSGQKGSSRLSPTMMPSRGWPFRTVTLVT